MSRPSRHIPPDEWKSERIEKVNDAFDLLAAKTDGLLSTELADALETTRSTVSRVVHDLRLVLGGTDTITVVTEPTGQSEPHRYRLVGNYEEARPWMTNRIGDLEARLETVEFSARAIANGADGRTKEFEKADKMQRTLKYLREELAAIDKVS